METAVVIPCYNEASRLPVARFLSFIEENPDSKVVFANDGSTDGTEVVLQKIYERFPNSVKIYNLEKNSGKAEAVRLATLSTLSEYSEIQIIGYLDADLSTSLEEWKAISENVKNPVVFAYGSRILKIDTDIRRRNFRHFTGRVVATFISMILRLKVYDTQCGCKAMCSDVAREVFAQPFISRWLFDVEIFFRISQIFGREKMPHICREIPLKKWTDVEESKVKFTYFFKLWYDLFLIDKTYNRGGQ